MNIEFNLDRIDFLCFYLIIAVVYLYHAIRSLISSINSKVPIFKNYSYLCLAVFLYTVFTFLSLRFNKGTENSILLLNNLIFLSAFLSWAFYIKVVMDYLELKTRVIVFIKNSFFIMSIPYILESINLAIGNESYLHIFSRDNIPDTAWFNLVKYHTGNTFLGEVIFQIYSGFFGISIVYFLYQFLRYYREQYFLIIGLFVSIALVVLDMLLVLHIITFIIPISMLGYMIETIRFGVLFEHQVYKKIDDLEDEVVKLSKAAEVGMIASSISHDIRNPLFAITANLELMDRSP